MKKPLVAITTGDLNGIGFEVACKALAALPSKLTSQNLFVVYRSEDSEKKYLKLLDKKFHRLVINSQEELRAALRTKLPKNVLIDFVRADSPAHWVSEAGSLALEKFYAALVTAPLSKTLIKSSGFEGLGHTDLLKKICKTKNVYMTFLGQKFNVLLATGHIPLTSVPPTVKLELAEALEAAADLHQRFKWGRESIYVLGLNPHAGEQGLIGTEDAFIETQVKRMNAKLGRTLFIGPIPPDAAFLEKNWSPKRLFVSMYHDQGLIPFKAIHGQKSGVHLSWGLPIIRTSVDHGTGFDIFGKNKAQPESMLDAIVTALKLI